MLEDLSYIDCYDLLISTGIKNVSESGGEISFSCPSSDHFHGDSSPSARMNARTSAFLCLAGETRVITKAGTKSIKDMALNREEGYIHEILTTSGIWKQAPFFSYGESDLMRIILSRNGIEKEIFATPNHKWYKTNESKRHEKIQVETSNLKKGNRLVTLYPKMSPRTVHPSMGISPFGIARGIVFGDGCRHGKGSSASLFGDKDRELEKWFPHNKRASYKLNNTYSDGMYSVRIFDMPAYFKDELPPLSETPSYLYGWLAGYFAADGDVGNSINLDCSTLSHLEYVRELCTVIGIGTFGIGKYERTSGFKTSNRFRYRIRLFIGDLTPDFFLLSHHRENFEKLDPKYARLRWVIQAIEKSDRHEQVFCAEVPKTHTFALEDNILSGNCHSCGIKGNGVTFLAWHKSIPQTVARRLLEERYGGGPISAEVGSLEEEVKRIMNPEIVEEEKRIPPSESWLEAFEANWLIHNEYSKIPLNAWEYMIKRGFDPEALDIWQIGYDLLSDRITIPIRDHEGKLVGFKGRAWRENIVPRYMILGDYNNQKRYGFQSYKKSHYVFGLGKYIHENRRLGYDKVVLVEGELNVIAMDQHGFPSIGIAGSEFSEKQLDLIKRWCCDCILFLDNDEAGEKGTKKVIEMLSPYMGSMQLVQNSPGDAAELDTKTVKELIENAQSVLSLQVEGKI